MDAKNDLILVIFIIIGLGIVWFFTGGAERERATPGAFLRPPAPLGSGEKYGGFIFNLPRVGINKDEITENQDEISQTLDDIKSSQGESSRFENKITIEKRTAGPAETSPTEEYLIISASQRNEKNISITGWQLESLISKKKALIGGGTELFRSGVINSESSILLKPGEQAIISTGRSPIGASFRVNKCVGYFEQFQDFSPTLRTSCPRPSDEFDKFANIPINDFTCEDIVNRMRACEMPLFALPIGTTNECSEFISININYTGCIKNHKDDLDFEEDEWRVFLGRSEELWRMKRETIQLIDNEGKVVDTFTY
jgi:hypothetical protein